MHGSSNVSEGSKATFICQDTLGSVSLKITWSFENNSSDILLAENGTLTPGVNRIKYKLFKSGTKLEIANITVNDSGNYKCVIRGQGGEIILSATGVLNVKGNLQPIMQLPMTFCLVQGFSNYILRHLVMSSFTMYIVFRRYREHENFSSFAEPKKSAFKFQKFPRHPSFNYKEKYLYILLARKKKSTLRHNLKIE